MNISQSKVILTVTTILSFSLYKLIKYMYKRSKKSDYKAIVIKSDDESLLSEQLKRNYEFFGKESMEKIKSSFVCVIGLGGVGSHTVMTLIRSGIQRIRVIDYDVVTLSSLNRHAFAVRKDVGLFKSKVIKNYCESIFPLTCIEDIDDAITEETIEKYLSDVDYVVDCIDDLNNKSILIKYCIDKKIPIISSMGAGGRLNPFLIRISDLNKIKSESVSKKLRLTYKKKYNSNIPNGIKCVFSIEKSTKALTDLTENQLEKKEEYKINQNERIRTIPVFASIPAIFGQSLAAVALCDLSLNRDFAIEEYNEEKEENEKKELMIGEFEIGKLVEEYRKEESKRKKLGLDVVDSLDFDDYVNIAKRFNYRSVISEKMSKIKFVIWNPEKGSSIDNIVLMTRNEVFNHYKLNSMNEVEKKYDEKLIIKINNILNSSL